MEYERLARGGFRVGRGILTEPLVTDLRLSKLLTSHRLGKDTSPYHEPDAFGLLHLNDGVGAFAFSEKKKFPE